MPLVTPQSSSGNIITQVLRLIFQPVTFFRAMPGGSQWVLAALLVLVVTGYTATTQVQSTASSASDSAAQSAGFDLSLFDKSVTQNDAASTTQPTQQTQQTATDTTDTSSDTILMNALIAASGMLVMWVGQTALLSLVSMFRGFAPQVGRSFQIAVWASLPLALMLGLRYVHYSTGGEGGALGLSLLLDDWSGYSVLTEYGQRIAAVFLSNLTLFWLWDVLLLYLGARYALGGRRFMVFVVVVLWVVASTLIPALVSEPETRLAPRQATSSVVTQESDMTSESTTTQQTFPGGNFPGGGEFPGGSGSFPGGGGGAPPGG
ncbi:MAG: hypothetical protein LC121_01370 [Anaerolineae bacterium]|nr:hypothetical protein [Anaerolineae bacterium]